MNKQEMITKVAEKTQSTKKDAEQFVDATLEVIKEALSESKKVQLVGFGSFEVRDRAARKAHNPQTGEPIEIPATRVPAFKAGKALKEAVK